MTRRVKLTDLQLVLLSATAGRADGMVLPSPDSVRARGEIFDRTLTELLALELADERPTDDPAQAWRRDEDIALGLAITAEGRAVLGLVESGDEDAKLEDGGSSTAAPDSAEPNAKLPADALPLTPRVKPGTKQARLVDLLSGPSGATIGEISDALGWQRHTTRAALTGLRRKGYEVNLAKEGDGRNAYHAELPTMARADAA